jgi:hypothetical protein
MGSWTGMLNEGTRRGCSLRDKSLTEDVNKERGGERSRGRESSFFFMLSP